MDTGATGSGQNPNATPIEIGAAAVSAHRKVIEAASEAWDRWASENPLGGKRKKRPKRILDKLDRACLKRLREGAHPQKETLERALYQLWNPEEDNDDAPLHDCHKATIGAFQGSPEAILNRCGFVRWFSDKFEEDRAARLEASREIRDEELKETNAKYVELGKKAEKEVQATKEVRARISVDPKVAAAVDSQLRKAGIEIVDGQLAVSPQSKIDPYPLHVYIQNLQGSATIPGYFPGVRDIPLDDLFVEVSAAEDQRGLALENLNSKNWRDADRAKPDHLGIWQLATKSKRISLSVLLSKARQKAAILFGDPGSGKSTATRHLLHQIGRNLVEPSLRLGVTGIPFRISLRELAKNGGIDGYCLARYVVRNCLGVPDREVEKWADLLYRLARKDSALEIVFLLDGIDELTPEPDSFEKVVEAAARILPGCISVWTSRRAGFKQPKGAYWAFELVELSERCVQAFVSNWFEKVTPKSKAFAESFIRWIFSDPRRQDLSSSPCLLGLLCFLNQDRKEGEHFLQATSRTRLYELAVDKLIESGNATVGLDAGDAVECLAGFALSRYTLGDVRSAPQVLFTTTDMRQYLRQTLHGDSTPLVGQSASQHISLWRRAKLIAQWDLGNWNHFLHLTFQEYFAARALTQLDEEEVDQLILAERHNPYWREVWRFYAGLCGLSNQRRRFQSLISRVLEPCDMCCEVLFLAAPLCAEYGIADLKPLIGIDLRERLLRLVEARSRRTIRASNSGAVERTFGYVESPQQVAVVGDLFLQVRVKAMVELDPPYFLERARQLIVRGQRDVVEGGVDASESLVLGVCILSHIYHPSALAYQGELIREECLSPTSDDWEVMLGPWIPGGRHEGLYDELVRLMGCELTEVGARRVMRYLGRTCNPDAGGFVLAVAREVLNLSNGLGEFLFTCLQALCDLQDGSAVELANRLAESPDFLREYGVEVSMALSRINSAKVADLMEGWLENCTDFDQPWVSQVLGDLKVWRDRPVPRRLECLLDNSKVSSVVLEGVWDLVVTRSRTAGVDRIRARIAEVLGKNRLTGKDWRDLAVLAEVASRNRCPMLVDLFGLADRVPDRLRDESNRIWASALRLAMLEIKDEIAPAWLSGSGFPKFRSELLRCGRTSERIPLAWLNVWWCVPDSFLRDLVGILVEVRDQINPKDLAELMDAVRRAPELIPMRVIKECLGSSEPMLKVFAGRMLRALDPKLLLESGDARALSTLLEATETDGVLFFKTRLYDPRLPGFVEYSSS